MKLLLHMNNHLTDKKYTYLNPELAQTGDLLKGTFKDHTKFLNRIKFHCKFFCFCCKVCSGHTLHHIFFCIIRQF